MKHKKTTPVKGHPFLIILAFTIASGVACYALQLALGPTVLPNPVTVEMLSPTQGSTVSGVITLSSTATSTVAPITRVEFYVDGVLVGTKTNTTQKPAPPTGLKFGL